MIDPEFLTTRERVAQEVFDKVLAQFEEGALETLGKGGVTKIVKNPKQAYAIASGMAERAKKRYQPSPLPRDFHAV
ncbi:hypothetical protein HKX48_003039 [Thoreauomyces humboldtii]|nr:hypothetical protein HKX48_003039 [Thoreauomyces humboldtii]